MTDEQRRAYDNLILVCLNSHTLIDDLEPDAHPVGLLQQMKQEHEQRSGQPWCDDDELTKFAAMLLAVQFGEVVTEPQDHEKPRSFEEEASAAG